MKHNSSRTSSTRPSNCARPCTVLVCTSLLCSPLCSVVGRATDADQAVTAATTVAIKNLLDMWNGDVTSIYTGLSTIDNRLYEGFRDQNNILRAIRNGLTNRPASFGGVDVLAGNPWWATNSQFAAILRHYNLAYPTESPDAAHTYSFPQFMSAWSAKLVTPTATWLGNATHQRNWDQLWGVASVSRWQTGATVNGPLNAYTWFDWMSDAMRSNWVLQANLVDLAGTTDAPSAVDTAASSAVDDGRTTGTNGIPAMVVEQMDVTGVEDALELVDADAVGDMLPSSFTGADPEVVVFSGGRYGAVTVPEVRASLALPEGVARYLRTVATWLWRVALFVGCFVIVRQEVAFWSTLGGSTSDA